MNCLIVYSVVRVLLIVLCFYYSSGI